MTEEKNLSVKDSCTLNEFLKCEIPLLLEGPASNSKIRRMIFSGAVLVEKNGIFFTCKNPSLVLKSGTRVRVFLDRKKFFSEKQVNDISFELSEGNIIFEDEYVIVVNKPAHFPTESTFVESRDNLHAAVVRYLHKKNGMEKNPPYAGIMHRLDRDTSGCILFSKQRAVNPRLHEIFESTGESREIKKIYLAACTCRRAGRAGAAWTVENFIGRVSGKSRAAKWGEVKKEAGGKTAKSSFKILKNQGPLYLIECRLFTGRTHQLRVHLSQSGFPVLGDTLYGGQKAERIYLHSFLLELPHPVSGKMMRFESPFSESPLI